MSAAAVQGTSTAAPPVAFDFAPLRLQLEGLQSRLSDQSAREINFVLEALGDVISGPSMCSVSATMESEEEAKMWACFAQVFTAEVEAYKCRKHKEPSKQRKQQLFADILVWAEITQPSYDQQAAAFLTGGNSMDENFQRIGRELAAAKNARGIRQ